MPVLYEYPLKPVSWNERDVLLFANSISIDPSELQYLYELHPKFTPFPTYPITLAFKDDHTTLTSSTQHFTRHLTPPTKFIPNFPPLDISRAVDGYRSLEILRQIPTTSENRNFRIRSTVVGIWDQGPGKPTTIQTEYLLVEIPKVATTFGGRKVEEVFTKMSETVVFMGQGGWGGPNEPSPRVDLTSPTREPDATHRHVVPANAHLLYRLNGDYDPLHTTEVQGAVVQPTPIMHVLYSWNVVAGVVARTFGREEGKGLRKFAARFVKPVKPGDSLEIGMWKEKKEGEVEVRFEVRVEGSIVLDDGVAFLGGGAVEAGKLSKVQEVVSRL